ncbi:Ig-like domain repeat protein [Methanobrevibacter sp.]|uniref:Ig-like domain repeat protein n=1 Tax=Methanobrevibacter sp. TaxID=66852 RepID=UPI002E771406|nr:Ig-like domain repeat protein [Methanobrevibacter sp.]MEE1335459.1 PQQ-binding-like beta-propeller repeat protein [Methanobrevibacter sp.]
MNKKLVMLGLLLVFLFGVSCASAEDNTNLTISQEASDIGQDLDDILKDSDYQSQLKDSESEITVENWEELQYYCSLTDKDYTLKLKENTNYYPTNPKDSNYQIKINNNVKIIGSNGSYIGDSTPDGGVYYETDSRYITYIPIIAEGSAIDITLENITFKWIHTFKQPDSIVMQIYSGGTTYIKGCTFDTIDTMVGGGSIVHLKKGEAVLEDCSFVNCNVPKAIIMVSEGQEMVMRNCYFVNNYGYEHSTCGMNWGTLTIYNTKFYKNRSSAWAGGITTYGAGVTNIYNCNFTDNVAGWNGGALYVYNIANIYNTTFEGNNCTTNNGGGAIGACKYSGVPRIYIEDCLFKDNNNNCWALDELSTEGTGRGGAISLMDEGSLEVRNTVFIANSASIGTAICAIEAGSYGSPDVIIVNNTFINHTRVGDVLNVRVIGTILNISDNIYLGNSIEFSTLTLKTLSQGNDQASLQVTAKLSHPGYYDSDILEKTCYDVYVNDEYVKTVNTTKFTVDFGNLDICRVYVVPTISNRKSNEVTLTSTREYIFVSQNKGSDNNNGLTRNTPVKSIKKALELAVNYKNIILLDGEYNESDLTIKYDLTLKGENDATLTGATSFLTNINFVLKNLKITNLSGNIFIKGNNSTLSVQNCIFNDNKVSGLMEGDSIVISKSIFTNNNFIVINNGFTSIQDSILLNNTEVIQGSSNYVLDYNWWGSTFENQIKPNNLNITNWLILKAVSDKNKLENNQFANVEFAFYLNDTKYLNLPKINLNLNPINGITNLNITPLNSKAIFTLTSFENATLTASYNNVRTSLSFEFLKSNPDINIKASEIMVGEDLIIQITVPRDATGNLTLTVGNITQVKEITNANMKFVFANLSADNYNVIVNYEGNQKYSSQVKTTNVNINKYVSSVKVNLSEIEVDKDLIITITTNDDATGNISLYINSKLETLTLSKSRANYTIRNITRGDYIIKAVYSGDDKYLESSDSVKIEVDNIEATINIKANNITYGKIAVIDVYLNDNATGNVTVTVDGISNTSSVNNGRAQITIANLDAGVNKNITVFYTGDDTYFNKTQSSVFTISKSNLTFSISADDIMIGQDAVIRIKVPAKTTGTFTIGEDTITIPISGNIEYVLEDLEIGEYTFTAIYEGNNYFTVSNTTEFKVCEYQSPQWSNNGANTQNTHQTIYESQTNGEIVWSIQIDGEIAGDLTIDSNGNIYIATKDNIYSFTPEGVLNYVFVPDTRESSFSGTCIGRDVVIAPKSGDTLYFINQSSGEKYGSSNLYQGSSVYAPVIDSNANIYIVSEYQTTGTYNLVKIPYRLWEGGGNPILIDLGKYAPLASPTLNDDVIVVLSEGRLRIIDAKTLKSNSIITGDFKNVRPVVGEDDSIYAVLGDVIVAYNPQGTQLWKTRITGGAGNQLFSDSEFLYATNSKGNLYKYDLVNNGKEYLVSNLNVTSGVLIGLNTTLYFGCDNLFYEITSEGNVLWKSDLKSKIIGSPVMDKNGVIYVTAEDNKVFALSKSTLKNPSLDVKVSSSIQGRDTVITIKWDGQATGNVSFAVNGVTYNEAIADGVIVKVIPNLPAGSYNVNVTYGGDLRFNKTSGVVSFTVKPALTVLKGNDITVLYSSNSYYKVKLTQNNIPLSGKTVKINFNGVNYNVKTDSRGIASFKIAVKPGKYTIKASYNGKVTKNTVTVKSIVNAKNVNAKKSAKTVKIKVTLSKVNKKYLKNKVITLKFNKKTFKAKTNSKGVVTFTIKNSIYKKLKAGKKYTYQVIYSKDNVKKTIKFK